VNSDLNCRTIFWIDLKSDKLEDFYTSDPAYSVGTKIHIGTATAVAERALHARVWLGCLEVLRAGSRTATLRIDFAGGAVHLPDTHVIGGRADAFVVHSRVRGSGVFDCWA
jgi:hypothetical protein